MPQITIHVKKRVKPLWKYNINSMPKIPENRLRFESDSGKSILYLKIIDGNFHYLVQGPRSDADARMFRAAPIIKGIITPEELGMAIEP